MSAIECVYRDKFNTFYRVSVGITGDPDLGRDAVHEAFAKAIRRRSDFRGDGSLEGWLWRTVINSARDQRRAARSLLLADEPLDAPSVVDPVEVDHSLALLRRRVALLPERQRIAVFLRYYVDMSYQEIALALEIRIGTVSATLNAAHKALRSSLREARDAAEPAAEGAESPLERRALPTAKSARDPASHRSQPRRPRQAPEPHGSVGRRHSIAH